MTLQLDLFALSIDPLYLLDPFIGSRRCRRILWVNNPCKHRIKFLRNSTPGFLVNFRCAPTRRCGRHRGRRPVRGPDRLCRRLRHECRHPAGECRHRPAEQGRLQAGAQDRRQLRDRGAGGEAMCRDAGTHATLDDGQELATMQGEWGGCGSSSLLAEAAHSRVSVRDECRHSCIGSRGTTQTA